MKMRPLLHRLNLLPSPKSFWQFGRESSNGFTLTHTLGYFTTNGSVPAMLSVQGHTNRHPNNKEGFVILPHPQLSILSSPSSVSLTFVIPSQTTSTFMPVPRGGASNPLEFRTIGAPLYSASAHLFARSCGGRASTRRSTLALFYFVAWYQPVLPDIKIPQRWSDSRP